jgi:hypothetical protein
MVAVPAGVVAGQMFQVQLPAAPAFVAGSPEQVLEAYIAAAGGSLHLGKLKGWQGSEVAIPILNAAGAEIATMVLPDVMKLNNTKPVTITLPDGSVALTLQTQSYGTLCGSAGGSFGETEAKTPSALNMLESIVTGGGLEAELVAGGQRVLSFSAPSRPWILPFLIITFCMGVFCLMGEDPPESYILKGEDRVGGVKISQGGCSSGGTVIRSNDPAVLRASLNVIAVIYYAAQFS